MAGSLQTSRPGWYREGGRFHGHCPASTVHIYATSTKNFGKLHNMSSWHAAMQFPWCQQLMASTNVPCHFLSPLSAWQRWRGGAPKSYARSRQLCWALDPGQRCMHSACCNPAQDEICDNIEILGRWYHQAGRAFTQCRRNIVVL